MDNQINPKSILVQADSYGGRNKKTALRCVSAARAYLLLRNDHQEHLRKAVAECGFLYLRFHGLFQDDMGVYREDAFGNPVYSWQYVDAVYDFLVSINLRPFVVFDFMPAALASGDTTVYWEKANVTPPSSYERWEQLVCETVQHFTHRYGKTEVEQWYFEVWNEPDNEPFFTGDLQEYCKLYESTARAVHLVSPTYRVGGPAVAGKREWVEKLIAYCATNAVPLDFVSAHNYATKAFDKYSDQEVQLSGMPTWCPGPSWKLGNQCYDPNGTVDAVRSMQEAIDNSAMPQLELHYTEWGLTWDYWDPLRDSYHAASYVLSRLSDVADMVDSISYCEISDIFEEDGPPTKPFHGGFGLINLQGITKPSYAAYRYLAAMGSNKLVCTGAGVLACAEADEVQVLIWNDAVRQNCENKRYYPHDLPPLKIGQLSVTISGLRPGRYRLTRYRVGYRCNDPYTLYMEQGCPASLSREETEAMRQAVDNVPLETRMLSVTEAGTFVYKGEDRDNDVHLLILKQC